MKLSKLILISLLILPLGSSLTFAKGDRHRPAEPLNVIPESQLYQSNHSMTSEMSERQQMSLGDNCNNPEYQGN